MRLWRNDQLKTAQVRGRGSRAGPGANAIPSRAQVEDRGRGKAVGVAGAGTDSLSTSPDEGQTEARQMPDDKTTEGQPTGADTQEPKTFTQEQLDAIIDTRLKRERDKQGQSTSELQDKLAAFEEAEEERARQDLSEQERQKADLEAAQSERDAAKAEAQELRQQATRTDWILAKAPPELPRAYRLLIQGKDEEALQASLEEVQAAYAEDFEALTRKKPSIGASSPGESGQPPGKEAPDATLSPLQQIVKAGQAGD